MIGNGIGKFNFLNIFYKCNLIIIFNWCYYCNWIFIRLFRIFYMYVLVESFWKKRIFINGLDWCFDL